MEDIGIENSSFRVLEPNRIKMKLSALTPDLFEAVKKKVMEDFDVQATSTILYSEREHGVFQFFIVKKRKVQGIQDEY
jgi:hypothetical protein